MRFVIPSAECPSRIPETAPDYLCIFLHGYGADGFDLIDLADHFRTILPNAAYLSPNAPSHTLFGGRQWFPLSDLSPSEVAKGAENVRPILNQFIDDALEYFKLSGDRLILAGFSQGAMIALDTGLRRKVAPRALIGYSGALPAADRLASEIRSKPPVLLCHGAADQVVPSSESENAFSILKNCGVAVQKLIVPHSPHTIDPSALQETLSFLSHSEVC